MPIPDPSAYAVRRLTPADAAYVPELTIRVNGPGYIHAEMYHPERLIRLNQSGELVSVVALVKEREVVGHLALERPGLDPIAESGEAMVLPEHQHHHLLDRMRSLLEDEARRERLTGIYGNTVTHHVFSQKTEERFGAQPIAMLLGASPAAAHRDAEKLPQRVSLLTYFKFIAAPGEFAAYAPRRHRDVIARLYSLIGRRVAFMEPAAANGEVALESSIDSKIDRASIRVRRAGANAAARLAEERERVCRKRGAKVAYLSVPLADPGAEDLCEQAEASGFFFCGIEPRPAGEGDLMKMQFLDAPIDFSLIQTDGAAARDLAAYVAGERDRIARV